MLAKAANKLDCLAPYMRDLKPMSSLIFHTQPDLAVVATDTLAVTPDGTPSLFSSKAIYLPHLKTIIAGTGLMFAADWSNYVNSNMTLAGLRNLNYHTPKLLRSRWQKLKGDPGFPQGATITVYQIGVREDGDQEIEAFAYRSTTDFESEPLPYGTRAKPDCSFPNEGNIVQHLRPMMMEQRTIQETLPLGEQLYIGGECVVMLLTKDSCTTANLFRFDDYDDHYKGMCAAMIRP